MNAHTFTFSVYFSWFHRVIEKFRFLRPLVKSRTSSSQVLNTSKHGDCSASQVLNQPCVDFFFQCNGSFQYSNLCLLPLILSQCFSEKNISVFSSFFKQVSVGIKSSLSFVLCVYTACQPQTVLYAFLGLNLLCQSSGIYQGVPKGTEYWS